jgi:hypothetical protein
VFIQNQDSSTKRSKKWDRQGSVISTGDHDQYLVRVEGTGRLTLRNRRFLRKFQERSQAVPMDQRGVQVARVADYQKSPLSPDKVASQPDGSPQAHPVSFRQQCATREEEAESTQIPVPEEPVLEPVNPLQMATESSGSSTVATPASSSPSIVPSEVPKDGAESARRSSRISVPRKLYDASSGTYK